MLKVYQKLKEFEKNVKILGDIIIILLNLKMPKHLIWSETHHYQTEAINSVPATEKYEKFLTKIKKTWKKLLKWKDNAPNIEKWDLYFTISQGPKTPSPRWNTSISLRKHLFSICSIKH